MNKIRLLLCLGIIGLSNLLLSCHTDYIKYEEDKDRVYFSQYQYVKGKASYNRFPYWDQGNRLTVSSYLNVMGFPADKDREVRIEIVDSLTTAIKGRFCIVREICNTGRESFFSVACDYLESAERGRHAFGYVKRGAYDC